MQQDHQELFDYAPMLLKVDKLAMELHDACLGKNYSDIPAMCADLIVEARMLRGWATDKMEKAYGE